MFGSTSTYCFAAIKLYGLSTIAYQILQGVLGGMDPELLPLYSLSIEGLFLFMKAYHIAFPQWIEALQDLC